MKSRPKRWEEACARARKLFEEAQALHEQMTDKLGEVMDEVQELRELQDEYEQWRDSLPENLEDSPTAERLTEVIELELDPADPEDLDEIDDMLQQAEGVELPRGFGRD